MTESIAVPTVAPARTVHPAIAAAVNLLFAPAGHVLAGATRRGAVLWLATRLATVLSLLAVVAAPGPATMAFVWLATAASLLLPSIDTLVRGRRPLPAGAIGRAISVAVVAFALGALLKGALVARVAHAYRQPSDGMMPTLLAGDYFYTEVGAYAGGRLPVRGEVVTFGDGKAASVKRVIALPGETIQIRGKRVSIDGAVLDEPYAVHVDPGVQPASESPRDEFGPYEVPADAVFLLGDNRDNSNDSRYRGPVPLTALRGRVRVLYWSAAPGGAPRWGRIGKRIG